MIIIIKIKSYDCYYAVQQEPPISSHTTHTIPLFDFNTTMIDNLQLL